MLSVPAMHAAWIETFQAKLPVRAMTMPAGALLGVAERGLHCVVHVHVHVQVHVHVHVHVHVDVDVDVAELSAPDSSGACAHS